MIPNEDEKFDWWNLSIADKVKNSSSLYLLQPYEVKNVQVIESYLNKNRYNSKHTAQVHLKYITRLINRLRNIRKDEVMVFPSNVNIDTEISKLTQLTNRIMAKIQELPD